MDPPDAPGRTGILRRVLSAVSIPPSRGTIPTNSLANENSHASITLDVGSFLKRHPYHGTSRQAWQCSRYATEAPYVIVNEGGSWANCLIRAILFSVLGRRISRIGYQYKLL